MQAERLLDQLNVYLVGDEEKRWEFIQHLRSNEAFSEKILTFIQNIEDIRSDASGKIQLTFSAYKTVAGIIKNEQVDYVFEVNKKHSFLLNCGASLRPDIGIEARYSKTGELAALTRKQSDAIFEMSFPSGSGNTPTGDIRILMKDNLYASKLVPKTIKFQVVTVNTRKNYAKNQTIYPLGEHTETWSIDFSEDSSIQPTQQQPLFSYTTEYVQPNNNNYVQPTNNNYFQPNNNNYIQPNDINYVQPNDNNYVQLNDNNYVQLNDNYVQPNNNDYVQPNDNNNKNWDFDIANELASENDFFIEM